MRRQGNQRPYVALGADHNGVALKRSLTRALRQRHYRVLDLGTHSTHAVDYPDIARALGHAVLRRRADLGILICGSGVGASVAANKIPGIRAGLCHDVFSARQSREDDDVNLLCLGAHVVGEKLAGEIVAAWLGARFSGARRHRRRLQKIVRLEAEARMGRTQARS
ncbi:MAG: ribose 5-phosphate isomerase B [Terriglobia bacterium]